MKKIGIFIALFLCGILAAKVGVKHLNSVRISSNHNYSPLESNPDTYHTTYTAPYISEVGEETASSEIQCPIPMKDRVKNGTGIQCVWASIEMIGRWAEEPKLMDPPLTSRGECKSYASPQSADKVLTSLNVKFEQSHGNRQEGLALIKKAMAEGRGALFGVPGHAMVLIHFDEKNDVVKWVDNSDHSLKIQTMTVEKFNKRWDSWVLVVYADNDIVLAKLGKLPRMIPIINHTPGASRIQIPLPIKKEEDDE